MHASLHRVSHSPNPSDLSHDSSSVSSGPSPRPFSHHLNDLLHCSTSSPQSDLSGPSPPARSQPALLGPSPTSSSRHHPTMGRDSIPSATESVSSTPGAAYASLATSAPITQTQKRAYRQRRKDPSCDACRERKVKCDATETTSCSECSSRNVKCQFTKETNRRMSSIKQVQDLEKQIDRMKRENSMLRRKISNPRDSSMDLDPDLLDAPSSGLTVPPIGAEPPRKKRPPPMPELSRARTHTRTFCKGIWTPPAPYRQLTSASVPDDYRPELPPRATTDQLLKNYFASPHTMFPIVHRPSFQAMVDDVYRQNLHRMTPSWYALFFAMLAMGSIFNAGEPSSRSFYEPAGYLDSSRRSVDPFCNEFDLDYARALILTAFTLYEMNLKNAAWNALGNAVRVGQEIGLYTEGGPWPVIEAEMRCRTWWTVYILDKTLALETGRPSLILDADCDVSLPTGVDDQFVREDGILVPHGAEPLTHSLLAIIHTVRSYSAIIQASSDPFYPSPHLPEIEAHLNKCLTTFPPACEPGSKAELPTHFLSPMAYLLNARLMLHRPNLSPNARFTVRLAALESCTHIALDTAALIDRSAYSPAHGSTALLVTHIFRCALFLLLTGYFTPAQVCVQGLMSINEHRDVNTACCRFLQFFGDVIASKRIDYASFHSASSMTNATSNPQLMNDPTALLSALARDEELMAYVSADAQASPATSWLWDGMERETALHERAASSTKPASQSTSAIYRFEARTGLAEEEPRVKGQLARLSNLIVSMRSRDVFSPKKEPFPTQAYSVPGISRATLPPPHINTEASDSRIELPRISDLARFSSSNSVPRYSDPRASHSPASSALSPAKKGSDRLSIANIM